MKTPAISVRQCHSIIPALISVSSQEPGHEASVSSQEPGHEASVLSQEPGHEASVSLAPQEHEASVSSDKACPPQVCEVLRILALDSARMKAYIDELLALVLERNSALLEGLPRIQLRGTRPELLTAASLPEVGVRGASGAGTDRLSFPGLHSRVS